MLGNNSVWSFFAIVMSFYLCNCQLPRFSAILIFQQGEITGMRSRSKTNSSFPYLISAIGVFLNLNYASRFDVSISSIAFSLSHSKTSWHERKTESNWIFKQGEKLEMIMRELNWKCNYKKKKLKWSWSRDNLSRSISHWIKGNQRIRHTLTHTHTPLCNASGSF